mmetsp:Transcript_68323/g.189060  ORF Transcript_68323/g.189060 Transcript_68323/m.189060 type:complete len:227 (+) Transcript_68323:231-911(+)
MSSNSNLARCRSFCKTSARCSAVRASTPFTARFECSRRSNSLKRTPANSHSKAWKVGDRRSAVKNSRNRTLPSQFPLIMSLNHVFNFSVLYFGRPGPLCLLRPLTCRNSAPLTDCAKLKGCNGSSIWLDLVLTVVGVDHWLPLLLLRLLARVDSVARMGHSKPVTCGMLPLCMKASSPGLELPPTVAGEEQRLLSIPEGAGVEHALLLSVARSSRHAKSDGATVLS